MSSVSSSSTGMGWTISSLLCVEHDTNDGLRTSTEGLQHSVLVKVPIALMEKAGKYRFVISAKDSHADREKGHRQKGALERNQGVIPPNNWIAQIGINEWMARGVVEKLSGVKVAGQGKQAEVVLADGQRVKCSLKDNYLSLSQIAKSLSENPVAQASSLHKMPTGCRRYKFSDRLLAIGCSVVAHTVYATTRKKPMVTK